MAPTNRIDVALPFAPIKLREPTPELVELAATVAEFLRATGDQSIHKRAEALRTRLHAWWIDEPVVQAPILSLLGAQCRQGERLRPPIVGLARR